MLALSLPVSDQGTPQRRRRGNVVWQPHYEGFTTIAYQSGKAIAGISGPWSDQYVLIWWDQAQPIRQVELFDSLEDAKQAVAEQIAPDVANSLLGALRRVSAGTRPSWFRRLRRWAKRFSARAGRGAPDNVVDNRRRNNGEETDLRGLNFRAIR